MALAITTNYAGQSHKDILQNFVIGNQAFEDRLFAIHEDIDPEGLELPCLSVNDNPIQQYVSMPVTPSPGLSITPRILKPVMTMIFDIIDPMMFKSFWKQFQNQNEPLADVMLKTEVKAAIIDAYKAKANNQLGRLIWQGNTTSPAAGRLNFFNGIITKALADDDVEQSEPKGNITASNAIEILTDLHKIIPDTIIDHPNLAFMMSTTDTRSYQDAIIKLQHKGQSPAEAVPKIFKGIKIYSHVGIPANHIIATLVGANPAVTNLHAAVNAEDDPDNLKFEKYRPEGDQYFLKAAMSLDVNYAWGGNLVMYNPQ